MRLGSYPVYHSIHDNYHWMKSFVDPDFEYNKVVTQIWVKYSLKLLDSDVIPFNITRYGEDLMVYIGSFEASYGELLKKNSVDLSKTLIFINFLVLLFKKDLRLWYSDCGFLLISAA